MAITLHTLPLEDPTLPALARWLLARAGEAPEGLAGAVVLLPSSRTCGQLGHALWEATGQAAILLPRIMTPGQLADHFRDQLGLVDPTLPDESLRSLLLAARLAEVDWLGTNPGAAAGLADELIAVFDQVRWAGCESTVLDGSDDATLELKAEPGGEEVLKLDLTRMREAWQVYRQALPRDHVDLRLAALARAAKGWPGDVPTMLTCAHLGQVDKATAACLRGLATSGLETHWLTFSAEDSRSRSLLVTYRDTSAVTHPLAGREHLAERLCGAAPQPPQFVGADLPSRLDGFEVACPELTACRDPEHESRVVAAAVCRELASATTVPQVIVATADLDLAARIAAQLRDAGIDVDDTRGRPLVTLPAGQLLRHLTRLVTGDVAFGPLFEVLTHPYVRLIPAGVRPGHAVRVQVLEAAVRRSGSARGGLAPLRAIAANEDRSRGGTTLTDLVDAVIDALRPLNDLPAGRVSWSQFLNALTATWQALAPERPFDGSVDPRGDHDDLGQVGQLLELLADAARHLLPDTATNHALALRDQLTDPAREVRPHRQRHLPVRLMGLVEARLEVADVLLVAGLSQDVFPGTAARPLFLPDQVRRELDLPHWREKIGRDAELLLRLLNMAPRVQFFWPVDRESRPSLPSPLVQRLIMVAGAPPVKERERELYRRAVPDGVELAEVEWAVRREPEPIPALTVPVPTRFSHTGMQRHRDCPYRFLLSGPLRLRRSEPLEAEFTPLTVGNLTHATMQRWLTVDGPGTAALAAGDAPTALAIFVNVATDVFATDGRDLPGSQVALRALLAFSPELVAVEIDRHREWRPAALEVSFEVPLSQAVAWLQTRGGDVPALTDAQAGAVMTGQIDRIDVRRDDERVAAVIDYKTGSATGGDHDLQLALYALSLEVGGVKDLDAIGHRVDHGAIYTVRSRGLGPKAYPYEDSQLLDAVQAIVNQAVKILDPDAPYALVPDWHDAEVSGRLPCWTCEFRGICRLEERDTTPTLAARVAALLAAAPRRD